MSSSASATSTSPSSATRTGTLGVSKQRFSGRSPANLLHHPAVAVRVIEGQKRVVVAPRGIGARKLSPGRAVEMERLTPVEPSLGERGTCGFDVRDNQVQPLHRTRRVDV